MSHKGGKAAGKGKKPAGKAEKSEDILQAVVRYQHSRTIAILLLTKPCVIRSSQITFKTASYPSPSRSQE